jgi:type II secretion system protein C
LGLDFERLSGLLNISRERVQAAVRALGMMALVVSGAYISASFASGYLMSGMMGKAMQAFTRMANKKSAVSNVNFAVSNNYRDIEKSIKERNLFNSTGEFPSEAAAESKTETKKSDFNMNAPCNKPTVKVALVGTIYMGEGAVSVATLQESGYSESDVYKVGDTIIGHEQASIVKIERNKVILNNAGVKECLELAGYVEKAATDGFPNISPTKSPDTAVSSSQPNDQAPASSGNDCAFEENYVRDELGPGFSIIIQKARLVPNTTDNQMNGFKIFAIDQGHLLGKTGLQNGDIITQVNETSLKQPEQGFTLYQAFQDEREVRINILRRGAPMMITCRIK